MSEITINLPSLYEEQNAVLSNLLPKPVYKNGRSIVTSCYRSELPSMFVLLNELRRLGIDIPVEIFYRENELNENEIVELENILPSLAKCQKLASNAKNFVDKWGNIKGWSTKVYAIYESEYAENLWIDSDNVPIKNILYLFDDSEYLQKGSLFWRDVYSIDRANQYCDTSPFWKVFQVSPNDGEPFESGQFLINKDMVWPQFCIMLYFTDKCEIYYNFGGDAECWRMAWQLYSIKNNGYHAAFNYHGNPNVPYGFMQFGPFHKGLENPWKKYGGGSVMVQRGRDGEELFNHRNLTKWSWKDNPFHSDVTNESNYHMIINHIKTKYTVRNV